MRLRVLCFGRLRELVAPEIVAELSSPATVADLWRSLREQYPALAPYDRAIAIAVNQTFASSSTPLSEGDEVALLPPVSGGIPEPKLPLVSAHACLQRETIDPVKLRSEIRDGEDGAVCIFDGIVRNHTRNRRTLYLDYDAYPAMALAEMEKLAVEVLARFPSRDLRIVHRVGRLEIGETSVLIVVASAHRAAAFDACRWTIDSLKKTVPVWKKEFFEDGATWADGEPFPPDVSL
jgi:molybdopterin synthase catalytic subunit/molybdopterin converting factor small subunit